MLYIAGAVGKEWGRGKEREGWEVGGPAFWLWRIATPAVGVGVGRTDEDEDPSVSNARHRRRLLVVNVVLSLVRV